VVGMDFETKPFFADLYYGEEPNVDRIKPSPWEGLASGWKKLTPAVGDMVIFLTVEEDEDDPDRRDPTDARPRRLPSSSSPRYVYTSQARRPLAPSSPLLSPQQVLYQKRNNRVIAAAAAAVAPSRWCLRQRLGRTWRANGRQ
jgi:hypothetical protein